MKNKVLCMLGLSTALSISSMAADIMVDDFESGGVAKEFVRVRPADIDLGWYASNQAETPSAWEIADGVMQNNDTNQNMMAEGASVQVVSYGADTNNVVDISFDYEVAAGDTLYLHVWGLDSAAELTGDWFANFQASNGGLTDNTSRNAGLTAFNIKDGGACGSAEQALVALVGPLSGTYTNSINIEGLNVPDVENAGEFEYYLVGFARNEDGTNGVNSVDNLSITTSYAAPPPPPPSGVVWENDMSADPVGDGWDDRKGGASTYSVNDGILTMEEGTWGTLLDTVPYNGFDGITKVDLRWRTTSHHDPDANYGAGLWLNLDGDAPFYYAINLTSLLNTNDNTQTVKLFDAGNGAPIEMIPGFGTGMIDASLICDAYNETIDYILSDGTLTVTGSVNIAAAGTDGTTKDHTLFTVAPSCEVDYVRLEANVLPDEVFFGVDPTELFITAFEGGAPVEESLEVTYNASTNLELVITITDETHPGTFSVLSDTPQIVPNQGMTELAFQFDPTVSNLLGGSSATGLAVIAWSELDGGDSGQVTVDLTGAVSFAAGQDNVWEGTGDGSSWGDAGNWSLGRIPGALAEDAASIGAAATVNVTSDFTGVFPWDNILDGGSTLNIYADLMGGGDLTVGSGFSEVGFVNQTNGAASVGALNVMTADSTINLTGGSLTVEDAFTLNGSMVIDGGSFIIDNADAGFAFEGTLGTVNITSGSFSTTRKVAQQASNIHPAFEISGGSLTVENQHYWTGGLTIIGTEPVVNLKYMNSTCIINMIMASDGISTINATGWNHFSGVQLTVDGTAYTAGSGEYMLFDGPLNSTSSVINVTGFPEGVEAYVTQDTVANEVKLIVNWPGYEGWIGQYGLSGPDAAKDFDYDEDGEVNFYEYALGGNPTNAAVQGYKAEIAVVDDGGTDYFMYVSPRRIGTEEYTGLMYEVQATTALPHNGWSATGVEELGVGPLDAEYEAVTNRVDMTGTSETFMRLYVEEL